ncbi:hypothetical protein SAY87_030425 [Trapa incisa]|uniref:Uncharacterized protein n=1 Tax=Trapa incisa TaxID=236973 RepID=A0AAN7QLS1_9MYRT|nr:hypothetical protein SAY87_030425 [Trapa incisa]
MAGDITSIIRLRGLWCILLVITGTFHEVAAQAEVWNSREVALAGTASVKYVNKGIAEDVKGADDKVVVWETRGFRPTSPGHSPGDRYNGATKIEVTPIHRNRLISITRKAYLFDRVFG